MLFQPSNITPSTFAGVGGGTVSPTDTVNISWQINGNSYLTKYSITFYKVNSDGSHTLITTLTNSVNISPTDNKGNPNFCTYSSLTTWGTLLSDTTGGYTYDMQITQYWSDTDSVTQFSLSRFTTRVTPTLTLNISSTIETANETVIADFSQSNGDTINWVRWQWAIGSINDNDEFVVNEILEDTEEVYTINTSYSMNGLVNGNTYGLICTVETSSGVQVSTNGGDWTTFTVEIYNDLNVPTDFEMDCTSPEYIGMRFNSVSISAAGTEISGTAEGSYEIAQSSKTNDEGVVLGSIIIPAGTKITWETVNGAAMDLEAPYTLALSVHCENFYGTILTVVAADGDDDDTDGEEWTAEIVITRSGSKFYPTVAIKQNGTIVAKSRSLSSSTSSYSYSFDGVIAWKATSAIVGGVGTTFSAEKTLTNIKSIVLGGQKNGTLTCNWLWVASGAQEISNSMEQPTFTNNSATQFAATFDYGLNLALEAGNNIDAETEINSQIYRSENGTTKLLFEQGGRGYVSLRDYGLKPCNNYSYSVIVFDSDEGSYGEIVLGENITKRQPFYLLLETTPDETLSNVYHVNKTWRFASNVSSSAISNNNSPNWLTNFTGYDLKQPSTQRGRSGTLQALLSNPNGGAYADTVEQMDALYAASYSTNQFFLKDPKGNIYMVGIAEPITQTISNKSVTLEVTTSLGWREVGDASGISLIQLPTDDGWNNTNQNS